MEGFRTAICHTSGHILTCSVTVLRRMFNSSKLLATFSLSAFTIHLPTIFRPCKLNGEMEKKHALNRKTNHSSQEKAENE